MSISTDKISYNAGCLCRLPFTEHTGLVTFDTSKAPHRMTLTGPPTWEKVYEQLCLNSSFEAALGVEWVEVIDAGLTMTTARSTAKSKFGAASLLLSVTGSTGALNGQRRQIIAAAAAEVWSFGVRVNLPANLVNCGARFVISYYTAADVFISEVSVTQNTATDGWITLSHLNQTLPATTAKVYVYLRVRTTAAGASGDVYYDGVQAAKRATLPDYLSPEQPYLLFDGANDFLQCPGADSIDLNFTSEDWTMIAWVNSPSTVNAQILLDQGRVDVDGWQWFLFNTNIAFRTNQGGVPPHTEIDAVNGLIPDVWQLLGLTRVGALCQHYRNGFAIPTLAGVMADPTSVAGGRKLLVGVQEDEVSNHYAASMAIPRIWNRALSSLEMASIFAVERFQFGV